MDRISVVFPEETEKYIGLQCNNNREEFSWLHEIKEIGRFFRRTPRVALDVGSGIGRASVFFFKYFNWTKTLFILADGDSDLLASKRKGAALFCRLEIAGFIEYVIGG